MVWGSAGEMPLDRPVPTLAGFYECHAPPTKHREHMTQKPDALMDYITQICVPGGLVLSRMTS